MTFNLTHLFLATLAYLSLLFLIAYATEHGRIPGRIARHPATYVLSLGVYATSWSYYGSVGFAQTNGYAFLTVYLGVTIAFVMTPILLRPILRLVREHQLTSAADLFAFRYRSQMAGILVTLFMLAGTLPYIALQIRAVTESIQVLTHEATPRVLALGFCVTLILFAILFGARHISPREKHEGLVVAIAFESLVKLLTLLMVGAFAVFGVFGGLNEVGEWLQARPEALEALYRPVREGPWTALLFLSFAAAFLLPRQFHMTFTENLEPRALAVASWAFPLFLLLLNLAIPPILWAASAMNTTVDPDYFVLGITLGGSSKLLPVLAFLGGVSAASAMMIVTTVALSAMCINHIILPASYPDPTVNLYRWLLWGRRIVISLIVLAGYGFYVILEHNQGLVELGLISFVAVAQFVPGVVGLLYWPQANRYGFIVGLSGGAVVWCATLIVPLLEQTGQLRLGFSLAPLLDYTHQDKWTFVTFWSLAVNGFLFVLVSLVTRQTREEREGALICTRGTFTLPHGVLAATSPAQFVERLAMSLGPVMAEREVEQALNDLGLTNKEAKPSELRQLRDQIQRNLSGLMGPEMARMVVNEQLQIDRQVQTAFADSVRMMEGRLEASRTQLRGLAAELDTLRRYHRQVLQELPIGVCSADPNREIVIWNHAMGKISGIAGQQVVGITIDELEDPWNGLLGGVLDARERESIRRLQMPNLQSRWFGLHKASLEDESGMLPQVSGQFAGTVILVEDLTETKLLEAELVHSERLASIGRLAAGVAHEIGNPVTGIACLAQNIEVESHDPDIRNSVGQILAQTKRISEIVLSLVSFSHSGTNNDNQVEEFNVRECVEEAIRLVKLGHTGQKTTCVNHCNPTAAIVADRQRLLQVFVNVLSNACDASAGNGQVEVSTAINKHDIVVGVRDQGTGMTEAELGKVFEPFYTTKEPGQGTGLGLALAYNIVKDHGGEIVIESAPQAGTLVRIQLPREAPFARSLSPRQAVSL